jgi:hypothetical protein
VDGGQGGDRDTKAIGWGTKEEREKKIGLQL